MAKQSAPVATRGGMVRPGLRVQSAPNIEFDARTAYDFVLLLCGDAGEVADLLPQDRELVETSRKQLPDLLRNGADDAMSPAVFGAELSRLVLARPEISTARDVVRAVDAM